MILRNFFYLGISICLFAACDQGQKPQANLKIQFDESIVGVNPRQQLKVSSQTTGVAVGSPNWGLADPTSLGDINCYALFVHGPEPKMRHSSCTNENDTSYTFGPRAGFYPISEPGEIQVLAGKSRTIYIVGMRAASNVSCPLGFGKNPELDSQNFSAPFVIGQATVDLLSGDNTISIPVTNSFTNANKVKDCDFFEGDLANRLVVKPHESERSYWIDDEVNSRTITIDHTAETIECSRDAGATYSPCDTNHSLVWLPGDYPNDHIIRATYSDGSTKTYSFNPSTEYPGLTIVPAGNCDVVISGAHTSASVITPYFTDSTTSHDNKYICFNDGADINFSSAALDTTGGAQNNVFIVREGHTATISNSNDDYVLIISGTDFKFIGLTINGNGNGANAAIKVISSGTFEIEDGEVSNAGSAQAVVVGINGTAEIKADSQISNSSGIISALYVYGSGAVANVKSSSLSSSYAPIYLSSDGMASIEDSELHASGGGARAFDLYDDATLTISDSKIMDDSGLGARLQASTTGTISTLTLNENRFVRSSLNSALSGYSIVAVSGSGTNVIHSPYNDNLFCNEVPGGSTPEFTGILQGTLGGGSFNAALNNGVQSISQCL